MTQKKTAMTIPNELKDAMNNMRKARVRETFHKRDFLILCIDVRAVVPTTRPHLPLKRPTHPS